MDFSNPGHVKIALLAMGSDITKEALYGVGTEHQEKIYSYSITDWVEEKKAFPSEVKVANKCYTGFHFKKSSPYCLHAGTGGGRLLTYRGEKIIDVSMIDRPKYYSKQTPSGIPLSAIGCSCANHGVSFFILDHCQYFNKGDECRFCTLVPTQKRFSDTLKYKQLDQVVFTMQTIVQLGDRIDFVQLSGGSISNHDREVKNYLSYIRELRQILDANSRYQNTKIHLTCMPPKDLSILEDLKRAGLNTISFDLECPNEEAFNKYCPGKAKTYGYQQMLDALSKALNVFGNGNVFSIIIAGIQPLDQLYSGVVSLIDSGITPTINIYHHDPLTTKMDVPEPSPEALISFAKKVSQVFHKNDVHPGLLGCAHYDIGHDIRKGFFDA